MSFTANSSTTKFFYANVVGMFSFFTSVNLKCVIQTTQKNTQLC